MDSARPTPSPPNQPQKLANQTGDSNTDLLNQPNKAQTAAIMPPPPTPPPTVPPSSFQHSYPTSTTAHPEIIDSSLTQGQETGQEQAAEIEIRPETPEISPEIAEHVERVTKGEIELPGPIELGEQDGEAVAIAPPAPQQPQIVLPVTQDDLQTGQTHPITSAFRWLIEWVKWLIKKYPGRAIYRQPPSS